jgi:hypothetical protein
VRRTLISSACRQTTVRSWCISDPGGTDTVSLRQVRSAVDSTLNTLSVRDMLTAMIAGQRDPQVLAGLARGRMKARHGVLVEALAGMFASHHAELALLAGVEAGLAIFCEKPVAKGTAEAVEVLRRCAAQHHRVRAAVQHQRRPVRLAVHPR